METFLKDITFYLIMIATPGLKHFEVNEFISLKPIKGRIFFKLVVYIYVCVCVYISIYI